MNMVTSLFFFFLYTPIYPKQCVEDKACLHFFFTFYTFLEMSYSLAMLRITPWIQYVVQLINIYFHLVVVSNLFLSYIYLLSNETGILQNFLYVYIILNKCSFLICHVTFWLIDTFLFQL